MKIVAQGAFNNFFGNLTEFADATLSGASPSQFTLNTGISTVICKGTGFTYSGGHPTAGTITGIDYQYAGSGDAIWSGMSVSVSSLWQAIAAEDVTTFNNLLFGGNDVFDLRQAWGTIWAVGGGGNDTFYLKASNDWTSIDGGAGTDTIVLSPGNVDYVTFENVANVEIIKLSDGGSYTLQDQPAHAQTIDASALTSHYGVSEDAGTSATALTLIGGAGKDVFVVGTGNDKFDGGAGADTVDFSHANRVTVNLSITSAQTIGGGAGKDTLIHVENVIGTAGADTITGSASNNVIHAGGGSDVIAPGAGNDYVGGDDGADTINLASYLTSADRIDGGAGADTVLLAGNYGPGVTFTATTMVNVEVLKPGAGFNYKLILNDATVAAGKTLKVDASALGASNHLVFDGSAETDGHFNILSGKGGDVLTGGALSDTFTYASAADSTSTTYDTIHNIDFSLDRLNVGGSITKIDATAHHTLSAATFDANLAGAANGHLDAHGAMLVIGSNGTLDGQVFLVVDQNGVAGYQAGEDLVIHLTGATGTLTLGDFI